MFNIKNNLICIFFILIITTSPFAQAFKSSSLPYDQIPLNQQTWQEVDMVYWNYINGHSYKNTIQLLRPKTYLKKYHLNKVNTKITLTLPELGLTHTQVNITAIKPISKISYTTSNNYNVVIGLFKHYATDVKTYHFRDLTTKKISVLQVTTNHPFYIKNKHQFVPIDQVSRNDLLVGKHNHTVQLICKTNQLNHCGMNNDKTHHAVVVYNLEVYKKHNYKVGEASILVHNCVAEKLRDKTNWQEKYGVNDINNLNYKELGEATNGYVNSIIKQSGTKLTYEVYKLVADDETQAVLKAKLLEADAVTNKIQELRARLSGFYKEEYNVWLEKEIIPRGIGNCGEYSTLGAKFLTDNGFSGIVDIYQVQGVDHAFLMLNEEYAIDPWSNVHAPKDNILDQMIKSNNNWDWQYAEDIAFDFKWDANT